MIEIKLELNGTDRKAFNLYLDKVKIGEMQVKITDNKLTVYHTLVDKEQQGKGYAGKLFEAMIDYVKENGLKVIPLCQYVQAQFERHPELYRSFTEKN